MAVTDEQQRALHAALTRTLALIDTSPLGTAISHEDRAAAERAAAMLLTACGGECIAVVRIPSFSKSRTTLSAPCLVRTKTSTESSSSWTNRRASNAVFFSLGTG